MDVFAIALKFIPMVLVGLLPIMNPISSVPLFLSLTKDMSKAQQQQQAFRASLYAFLILAAFMLLGHGIIALFGISLAGIRVAGGLIVLILAFRMLFAGEHEASTVPGKPEEIKQADLDFSFSPLAMPMLAGPGSIAVVMGFGAQVPDADRLVGYAAILVGVLLCAIVAYIALMGAQWVAKYLGAHGIQAVTKIMGFLLTCVAVQLIASGLREFIGTAG
ncbi:MarC family NAAT transporter [Xanthobacteraceae bacterium A53D]